MATISFNLDVNGTVTAYQKTIPNAAVARVMAAFKARYKNPGDVIRRAGIPKPPETNAEVWSAIGAEFLRHIVDRTFEAESTKNASDAVTATQRIMPT